MKIGVISDTHGRIDAWQKAMEYFSGAEVILHAGDVLYHPPRLGYSEGYDIPAMAQALNESPTSIVIAQGNCDAQVYEELLTWPVQSPYAFVQVGELRILVNHGHLLTRDQMIELAEKYKADIFISGHTHIPVLERTEHGVILMNPGSPSIPKYEKDGRPIGSVGLIEDDKIRIVSIEDGETLIELPL